LDPLTLRVLAFSAASWVSAVSCSVASAWHVRRLTRHDPPSLDEVRVRLAKASSEGEAQSVKSELREERTEAERALSLATLVPRSLARVALASGTALALTSMASGLGQSGPLLVAGAAAGFAGGFVGMIACTAFGRQAKGRATEMRRHWKRASEAAEQWTPGKASG
jgi:hypothetical protein